MRGRPWVDLPSARRYSAVPLCRVCARPIYRGGGRVNGHGIVCDGCDRQAHDEIRALYFDDEADASERKVSRAS